MPPSARLALSAPPLESLHGPARAYLYRYLRQSMGLSTEPRLVCDDPEASFFPVNSVARQVHDDLATMAIGGLTALFLQTLHPGVMAGVAQHSSYQDDPFSRLGRTSAFLSTTTYGSAADAHAAIDRVRSVHRRVRGIDATGRPYTADDADLVLWVHATEVYGFLTAARRYGPTRLTREECDRYVDEMAVVAIAFGVDNPPRSVASLEQYFADHQGALLCTEDTIQTRNFLVRGVRHWPHEVLLYSLLVTVSLNLMPRWGRSLLGVPVVPLVGTGVVQPAGKAVASAVRLLASANR